MRIDCASCKERHDSSSTPFIYDIVETISRHKEEVPRFDEETGLVKVATHYFCQAEGEFVCKKCGLVNKVSLKWQTAESKNLEEAKNEPTG
jgi:uncharacterized UBP type Zn finger protein